MSRSTLSQQPNSTVPSPSPPETIVLKFGSSVLTHEREVWSAVAEIRREIARGRRVVAVVSALWGVTDRLLADARRVAESLSGHSLARLLATGEHQTAALLSLALGQADQPHTVLTARDARLIAAGSPESAVPVSVDTGILNTALSRAAIVVISGFDAIDADEQPVLLGRGGSDLTAVFLADALGADVRLVKDVDGVFEHDPGRPGPAPRRFKTIAWGPVPEIAARLVQPRAVDFAAQRGLRIHVAAINSIAGTWVGESTELGDVPDPQAAPAFGPLATAAA